MLARLLRFYPGLTVADYETMTWARRETLVQWMITEPQRVEAARQARQGSR